MSQDLLLFSHQKDLLEWAIARNFRKGNDIPAEVKVKAEGERFQLVANEAVKIGPPVSRPDADYWIEQIKARALEPGEMVGRVKVDPKPVYQEEGDEAWQEYQHIKQSIFPTDARLEQLLEIESD